MSNRCDKRWQTHFGVWVANFGVDRLAHSLEINRQSVYHWISGRTAPTPANALRIKTLSGNRLSLQKIYGHREGLQGNNDGR